MKKQYFGPKPDKTSLPCKFGLHSWCHQSGFDDFYFCNRCSIVNRSRA